ncbi:MAG: ribose-phosphate diphosphokinase [Phycisphaerae bacterium]
MPHDAPLANAILATAAFDGGDVTREAFPDGEWRQRVDTPVEGRNVIVIGGAVDDAGTARLFDLCCGLTASGAASLTLVMPYFAYSTMDRASSPGEVVTARTRALPLSSVLRPPGGLRILLAEPHTDAIPYHFAPHARTGVVDVSPVIERLCTRVGGERFMLASTDAGRVKTVQRLAERLGVDAAIAHKQRLGPARTRVVALLGDVRSRHVVLYDDMVRTGASLLGAARACLDAGAASVSAVVTHAVLPGDALDRLRTSGLIDRLAATDTHPASTRLADAFLLVESVAACVARLLTDGHPLESAVDAAPRTDASVEPIARA